MLRGIGVIMKNLLTRWSPKYGFKLPSGLGVAQGYPFSSFQLDIDTPSYYMAI